MENEQGQQSDNDENQENSYEHNLALEQGVQNTSLDKGQSKSNNTQLQTPYSSSRLQRRLLNTHYTARTAIEEQGVNILFLALGMLHWYEDQSSEILRKAPLVLVPVSLSRGSVRSGFKLEYTGDEIDTNLSLQMKLKIDFGIDLPSIADSENGFAIQDYFAHVSHSVEQMPRWDVDQQAVALGFFSFSKLLMYKDLDQENWPDGRKPSEHEVLCSLLHEGFEDPGPLFDEKEKLDEKVDPADLHQVRDADSSQTMAVLEMKAGRNIVIQGPPGTGKSQTITNLIAEAIADGKKVLFVSEKMAALEVVKRRMDDVGLGEACMELHSHKTNKKAFLAELQKTLSQGRPRHKGRDKSVEELRRTREHLNRYSQAIHAPIGLSGVTPYQAYGILLRLQERLRGISVPVIDEIGLKEWTRSEYIERRSQTEELQALVSNMGMPQEHPFWGSRRTFFLPSDRQNLEEKCRSAFDNLKSTRQAVSELAESFNEQVPKDYSCFCLLISSARHALDAPDLKCVDIERPEWFSQRDALQQAISVGKQVQEMHERFDPLLLPETLNAEILEARKDLAAYQNTWWRLFSSKYRQARRKIAGLYKEMPPRGPAELQKTADAILEMQRWEKNPENSIELLAELCGSKWNGWRSDWEAIEGMVSYLARIHEKLDSGEVLPSLFEYLKQRGKSDKLEQVVQRLEHRFNDYQNAQAAVIEEMSLDQEQRFGEGGFLSLPYDEQEELLRTWESQAPHLQDIVTWNHLRDRMQEYGIGIIAELAATWEPASEHLVDVLEKTRHELLLEEAMRERQELAGFDGKTHTHRVQKFQELDKSLLELNRAYLARLHWEGLPGRSGAGQVGILNHEFAKKRRHRPIRRLMMDAGNALQNIKPVFMMSPLSVAAFIPPESIQFDLVVFDEASQVRPVDALGAILRSRQTVVVGDSRQLPPTKFFDKVGELDDYQEDEWDSGTSDLESVLGLFSARGAPDTMLRWHYRSRHESLIAVSNHEFYEDKLIVFPAPDYTRRDLGLVFNHLSEAAYERGKAINRTEASIVANAVLEHARKSSDLTLGVASFNLSQMRAIQDELELLRYKDPSCEGFFADHPEEPFFVKNLESVQGDERDVIFISVGFGRTSQGYLAMNFGPLNQEGGERRLNVLITRARMRCEVFSNLQADDIDLNRSNARGVAALKTFLKYAASGILDVPKSLGGEVESPFEEAVYRALTGLGFEVHPQVGSAGFRIDLAVTDPDSPGRYLLGIECDGAAYHSAQWARDRDRLRQEVLESLGWQIHRVWSTDWFRDPASQLKRILESIEKAKVSKEAGSSQKASCSSRGTYVENEGSKVERESASPEDEEKVAVHSYHMASMRVDLGDIELHEVSSEDIGDWIEEIVKVESPVHLLEVTSRIVSAAGIQRSGRRIRAAIERGAKQAAKKGRVVRKRDFLWQPDMKVPVVRDRSMLPSSSRKIERVAPEEIKETIRMVIHKGVGVTKEEALIEACRLLGYARATENIRQYVEKYIQQLLDEKEIILLDSSYLTIP
jgi:very-short-patch-repair endonuclease